MEPPPRNDGEPSSEERRAIGSPRPGGVVQRSALGNARKRAGYWPLRRLQSRLPRAQEPEPPPVDQVRLPLSPPPTRGRDLGGTPSTVRPRPLGDSRGGAQTGRPWAVEQGSGCGGGDS